MTIFLFTLAVLLMIFIPLGLAIWLRRRFQVPWLLFCLGMLTFVGSQIYHIPLNNWLGNLGIIGAVSADAPDLWRTAVILGDKPAVKIVAQIIIFYHAGSIS